MMDLTRASVSVPASYNEITRDPKWSEPRGHLFTATTGRYRQQEWTLVDGQSLYVVGGARIDDSGADVVVDGTGPGEFLVTTRSEASIAAGRRAGTWCLIVIGVLAAAFGGGGPNRSPWSYVLGGLAASSLVVAWGTFELYNRLVRLKQLQERAWSLIDVQLARRVTLIPQLAEVVKGYAAHEAGLQQEVAAGRLGSADGLTALREAYPQLKADTVFQGLFDELTATENRIAGARDYFNEAVTILRDRTRTFPGVLLAGRARAGVFGARDLIVAGEEERARLNVSLGAPTTSGAS
jgi:LemA protein